MLIKKQKINRTERVIFSVIKQKIIKFLFKEHVTATDYLEKYHLISRFKYSRTIFFKCLVHT